MLTSKKAISLTEIVVVSVLLAILVLGISAATTFLFQTYTKLKDDISKSTELVLATYHLNKNVKDSSYTIIEDEGATLEVYSLDNSLSGTYALEGNTLTFTDPADAVTNLGDNISLTFSQAGQAYGRTTETRVEFTEPFVNILHITSRLSPAQGIDTVRLVDSSEGVIDFYNTIQEAIDDAQDGYIVQVAVKTGKEPYYENINIAGKSITIRGRYDSQDWDAGQHMDNPDYETIIDGSKISRVVFIATSNSEQVTLDGFTIQNGYLTSGSGSGGGVYAQAASFPFCGSASITISNNTISGNTAKYGGGVYAHAGSSTYLDPASITISNNTISGNTASGAGGVYAEASSAPYSGSSFITISNNTISGNTASGAGGYPYGVGGGVYAGASTMPCTRIGFFNNTISKNKGEQGSGVFTVGPGIIVLKNTIIYDNIPPTKNVLIDSSNTQVSHCCIDPLPPLATDSIGVDPLFIDPEAGDFGLQSIAGGQDHDSPCIDAGIDPDGNPTDMGAYGGPGAGIVGADETLSPTGVIGAS